MLVGVLALRAVSDCLLQPFNPLWMTKSLQMTLLKAISLAGGVAQGSFLCIGWWGGVGTAAEKRLEPQLHCSTRRLTEDRDSCCLALNPTWLVSSLSSPPPPPPSSSSSSSSPPPSSLAARRSGKATAGHPGTQSVWPPPWPFKPFVRSELLCLQNTIP